jgi:hypothetical protein
MTPFSLFFLPSWVLIILSCIPFSHGFLPIHQQLNFRILALNENELDNNSSEDKDLIILCVGDALLDCIATNEARGWSVDEKLLPKMRGRHFQEELPPMSQRHWSNSERRRHCVHVLEWMTMETCCNPSLQIRV